MGLGCATERMFEKGRQKRPACRLTSASGPQPPPCFRGRSDPPAGDKRDTRRRLCALYTPPRSQQCNAASILRACGTCARRSAARPRLAVGLMRAQRNTQCGWLSWLMRCLGSSTGILSRAVGQSDGRWAVWRSGGRLGDRAVGRAVGFLVGRLVGRSSFRASGWRVESCDLRPLRLPAGGVGHGLCGARR